MSIGKKVETDDNDAIGRAHEGSANMYYGLIRSGKTYGATADIIEEVKQGHLVYATWPIKLEAFDDRESLWLLIFNTILHRKRFYKVDCAKNFHYIDAERGEVDGIYTFNPKRPSEYIEYLNKLNHCSLYIDEAWRVIDSYKGTQFSVEGRNLILVTGHKFRTVNLIAQRPTSVHVTARGNINRFFKFVKIMKWPWIRFARYEFQEMTGETVDETKDPISVKTYWAKKSIYEAYNSYFYGDLEPLHKKNFEVYELTIKHKLQAFRAYFRKIYTKLFHKKNNRIVTPINMTPL